MATRILALGLDPAVVELPPGQNLTPAAVQAFIDAQLDRVRALGYEVVSCLVDRGRTAEQVTERALRTGRFDGVVIGAGLRAGSDLQLFEKLLNLVHALAPGAAICFNSTPADTAEAVQRWVRLR